MALKLELVDAPSETPFVRAEVTSSDGVEVTVYRSTKLAVEVDGSSVSIRESE